MSNSKDLNAMPLVHRHCSPATTAATAEQIQQCLIQIPAWKVEKGKLTRTFTFADYYRTIAFVNAVAWISHLQDHHPDLAVSYNKCTVSYTTHSVGGLSESDFICAARVGQLAD